MLYTSGNFVKIFSSGDTCFAAARWPGVTALRFMLRASVLLLKGSFTPPSLYLHYPELSAWTCPPYSTNFSRKAIRVWACSPELDDSKGLSNNSRLQLMALSRP